MSDTAVDEILDALQRVNASALRTSIENLRAVEKWARERAGINYEVDDRVVIVSSTPQLRASTKRNLRNGGVNGWYRYRESLAVGQSGVVRQIYFSAYHNAWHCMVALDRAWSIDEDTDGLGVVTKTERRWKGPVSELPEGYVLPSAYDVSHYPHGQLQNFALEASWLRADYPGAADFIGCDL